MGHNSSKSAPSDESTNTDDSSNSKQQPSYRERIKRKFHLHRRTTAASKLNNHDDFAGIALLTLINAEMQFKDKWLACISIGEQTFRTDVSDQTEKPVWNSEKKFLLEKNGPHIAKVSVFETNRMSKNNLIGYCEIDLFEFLSRDSDSPIEVCELFDPSSSNVVVGKLCVSCSVEDPIEIEKSFTRRILSIVDYNGDGKLSFSEFSELVDAFGNQIAAEKKEELFKAADENGDGVVSMDELASLLAMQQEKEPIINCCPVCGELLKISNKLNSMIHMSLCFDEDIGNQAKKFSIQGLLGNIPCSNDFIDGTLVIFRLAPQDYHRFHFPVSGTIEQVVDIPGSLYRVNPIAVNSKYCNVFTDNKRAVSIISTANFGKVAFVATMVGSITFTKKKGDCVQKGDEFGYFSFGGRTVICVFEKDILKFQGYKVKLSITPMLINCMSKLS